MGNKEILQTMHDFLDYVEGLQVENNRLQVELRCAESRLAKLDNAPQEQPTDCRWVSVDDDRKPFDGEQVVVETFSKKRFMQTYFGQFTSEVAHWLRLPENNN